MTIEHTRETIDRFMGNNFMVEVKRSEANGEKSPSFVTSVTDYRGQGTPKVMNLAEAQLEELMGLLGKSAGVAR